MEPESQRQSQSAECPVPMVGRRDLVTPNPKLKLLDQVREVMRLKHYALRTERAYCDWIRRYIEFHQMRSPEDLQPAEAKMESFLSDLGVNGKVAASTQNQAFNALLFLYREVVHHPLGQVQALRADRPVRVPVVLTVEEVRAVMAAMSGTPQLVAKYLHPRPAPGRRRDEKPVGLPVSAPHSPPFQSFAKPWLLPANRLPATVQPQCISDADLDPRQRRNLDEPWVGRERKAPGSQWLGSNAGTRHGGRIAQVIVSQALTKRRAVVDA